MNINLTKGLSNERGSGLLWIYMTTIILGLSSAGLYGMSLWQSRHVTIDVAREKAFYYAEAAVDKKLKELRSNNTSNFSGSISEGSYSASFDSVNSTITATGTSNGVTRTITAKLVKSTFSALRGAITGNGNMSTNGSIKIDGRDHDLNGNVVGSGKYGVATSGSFSQGGSSKVGGNGAAPADPAQAGAVETNGATMPSTPEEILGLPAGALDQYKTTTLPDLPFTNQIVYLTANGTSNLWDGPDFGECDDDHDGDYDDDEHHDDDDDDGGEHDDDGHHGHHGDDDEGGHHDDDIPSTGIMIFHNASNTAELKNVHGCFQGIIITDKMTHINGDAIIRGAVALISSNSNIGNGSAQVQYSSEAIASTPLSSNYSILSWEDSLN